MTLFKHTKHIQKEFERLQDMVNFEPLKKPVKAKKYYTGTFTDNEGKTVTIENGQVKSIKSP